MPWFLLPSVACGLPEPFELANDTAASASVDTDRDGYPSDVDCDDDDASVHPDADEVCLNGQDESCVDGADDCVWSGARTIEGLEIGRDERGTDVGSPIALCDVNADRQLDLVMAGPNMRNKTGAVYVFHGPLLEPRTLEDAHYTLLGTGPWKAAGSSLDCRRDVDGDGVADLVVGEHGNSDAGAWGAAYVVSGDGDGVRAIDDEATFAWTGNHASELYGYEVVALDEDGNGRDDVAVTIWGTNEATQWGRTSVISTPDAGNDTVAAAAAASVYGSGSDDSIMRAHNAGDLDGDGFEELAVVRRNNEIDALYLFRGPLIGDWKTVDADVRFTDTDQGFAQSVGHADLDSDGTDDLFAGNPDSEPSAVYVFLGAVSADASTAAADVRIYCNHQSAGAGMAVVSPGDVSADGESDLLVGANGDDAVYLIAGGTPGVFDLDVDAQAVLKGNHVGWALATGEVTGDDITDFVITEYKLTGGGSGVVVMPSIDF